VTLEVAYKLLAIFATVALGWLAGVRGWLAPPRPRGARSTADTPVAQPPAAAPVTPAQVLSDLAFTLFVPALLFRTMVRQDFAQMPWHTLAAYFVPAMLYMAAVYAWHRLRRGERAPAGAATLTVTATYGNAVQLGIPISAALFGETGLALHVALVSLHGLLLLTRHGSLAQTVRSTVRNSVLHPVTLPVLAGMAWNLTGLGLHPAVDQALAALGAAVVPVCLVLIGLNLAQYGIREHLHGAAALSVLKLLVLPGWVLLIAGAVFGLQGTALAVVVMMGALPVGSNALIFAQRYRVLQPEATAAIVVSTGCFMASAALWLALLAWWAR
jgi:predicted permease